ncbi:MAG: DUF4339 domain-containing protein [Verrucomicrobiota bacterium]
MKYRIVGADGKTYGPVELQQIRQWLAEGRAEGRTPVYVEGADNWTSLGRLPELAAALPRTPPTIGAVTPAAGPRGTNGFATAGLLCSLCSWLCCCCCGGLPLNLLGLILCLIALVQISSQTEPQEGRLFAIIGLVLSGASLLFGLGTMFANLAFDPATIHWQAQFQ